MYQGAGVLSGNRRKKRLITVETLKAKEEEAMKNHISANEAQFNPQYYKTFPGALEAFFSQECPQLGGSKTRQTLVTCIYNMVLDFFPETTHLRQGQIPWVTVHKNAKGNYGKKIQDTRLTSVVLDLVQLQDIKDRSKGKKLRDIKKEAIARLLKQAYEQDGCMTNSELGILLKISSSTVSKYIKEWELENKEVLPRRGSIHDIGPTLTHKKIIIEKLFVEEKSVQQVSRETYHSLRAIQRYIETFRKILICEKNNMNMEEKAYTVGISKRLLNEYQQIIDEYKDRGFILEKIEQHDIKVETATEIFTNEYGI